MEINQSRRSRAEGILVLIVVLVTAATAVALGTHRKLVMLPIPAGALVLLAVAFQQFADVSVLGAARKTLERLINDGAGGPGLIYETTVAPIRQHGPLVRSVRALQSFVLVLTLSGIAAATVVAFERSAKVWIPYTLITAFAMAIASASYRDMLRSADIAAHELDELLRPSPAQG